MTIIINMNVPSISIVWMFRNGMDLIQYNLHPQRHRKDVSNFDRQFTSEGTELTPTDKLFMMNLDQVEMLDVSQLLIDMALWQSDGYSNIEMTKLIFYRMSLPGSPSSTQSSSNMFDFVSSLSLSLSISLYLCQKLPRWNLDLSAILGQQKASLVSMICPTRPHYSLLPVF